MVSFHMGIRGALGKLSHDRSLISFAFFFLLWWWGGVDGKFGCQLINDNQSMGKVKTEVKLVSLIFHLLEFLL